MPLADDGCSRTQRARIEALEHVVGVQKRVSIHRLARVSRMLHIISPIDTRNGSIVLPDCNVAYFMAQ